MSKDCGPVYVTYHYLQQTGWVRRIVYLKVSWIVDS
jgi:hypothetical protein